MTGQLAMIDELSSKPLSGQVNAQVTESSPVTAFIENFHVLAEAAGDVVRLRGLILDLATRGRLLEQRSSEGTAREYLATLSGAASKKGEMAGAAELFALPPSWSWTSVGAICSYVQRGKSPAYVEYSSVPVVSQKCVQWEGFLIDRARFIDLKSLDAYAAERFLQDGDLLWNSTGHGTVGRIAVYRADSRYPRAVADSHVTIVRTKIEPRFLWCWIASPTVQSTIDDLVSGTTKQTELATSTVLAQPVPLPPLAEQKRIVAKVDQLMALCDELEARQTKKRDTSTRLTKSALEALTTAESPDEIGLAWSRVSENFSLLCERAVHIDELREAILRLAIRGLLTRQDLSEEPASALRDRILRRLGASHSPVDSAPFQLPLGWCWTRLPELGVFGRGRSKHRPRNDPKLFANGKYPMVQTGDVARSNGVITTHTSLYGDTGLAQSRLWPKGTLCITIAANIADSGLLGMDACFPDSVVGFIPDEELGGASYFEFFLRTAKTHIEDFAPSTAQKNINLEILGSVLVPLPPLAEQRRIVTKVEQLLRLCDEAQSKLLASEHLAARLAGALVTEAVSR